MRPSKPLLYKYKIFINKLCINVKDLELILYMYCEIIKITKKQTFSDSQDNILEVLSIFRMHRWKPMTNLSYAYCQGRKCTIMQD